MQTGYEVTCHGALGSGRVTRDALHRVLSNAASGELNIDTEHVRLADIEEAWWREPQRRRLVVIR